MESVKNNKLYIIILIIVMGNIHSLEIVAQKTVKASQNSDIKKLNKKPILEARFENNNFQSGSSIELALKIKNVTNSTIIIFDALPERGFDIVVKDSNGSLLPLAKEGERIKYPNNIVRRESVFIDPNDEVTLKTVYLDRMFDLKRPGTYTLEVKATYFVQNTSKKNKSPDNKNNIVVSVVNFVVE